MAKYEERSRSELLNEARELKIERPERMTRVELRDAIIQRTVPESQRAEARGLFGVARSMLASVVETGLNLPDAAKVIRGDNSYEIPVGNQSPVATVTLAEIYAAQGHKGRALRVLDELLREEPDHEEALRVRAELALDSPGGQKPAPPTSFTASTPDDDSASEAVTAAAPAVAELGGETTDYVPGGFVETTGEAIETNQPPLVEEKIDETEEQTKGEWVSEPALVVAQSSSALALYWELPDFALSQCGLDESDGYAALRLVAFTPSGTAPERSEKTIALASNMRVKSPEGRARGAGVLRLDDFALGATVRAAVGWQTEDAFLPLSVGRSLQQWGAERSARELLERSEAALSALG